MSNKSNQDQRGSPEWNDLMFSKHPTPYTGIAGWVERRRVQAILNIISANTGDPNFTLLEIGCEAGNLLKAINEAFPKVQLTGFDISEKALKLAKTKLKGTTASFLQGDITASTPISSTYDIIVCSETLEHIPDYQSAIHQIAQLGTTETLFIFTVPLEGLKNKIKRLLNKLGVFNLLFQGIEKGMSEWHVNDFSKKEFLRLLRGYFTVLQYRQIMVLHQVGVCKRIRS